MLISQLQAAENKRIFITSLYKKLQNCLLTVSQIFERMPTFFVQMWAQLSRRKMKLWLPGKVF